MPSGKVAQPSITDNKDGTVTVRYAPSEAGLHEMDIRYDNMHIPGAPFTACHRRLTEAWGSGRTWGPTQGPHYTWPLFLPQEAPCSSTWITSTVATSPPTGQASPTE